MMQEATQLMKSGGPVMNRTHTDIDPRSGQQKDYVVLTVDELKKGFVRPVRHTYTHKTCGYDTTMSKPIAETFARNPKFYNGTFCVLCGAHRPLAEFVWQGTNIQVGT